MTARDFSLACAAVLLAACSQGESSNGSGVQPLSVSDGMQVSIEYTLRLKDPKDGEIYDTNVGSQPMVYTQGGGQLVRGLERALEGMAIGERKQVVVPAADGYGEVNPLHVSEIPKELIPPDARKVGTEFQTAPRHGHRIQMKVKEIKKDTIVMDLNHPLAGKTLYFDVSVVGLHDPRRR